MKLNNRGWGLGVMIAFLCIFLLAIIVITIIAYNMGIGTSSPIPLTDNNIVSGFIYLK